MTDGERRLEAPHRRGGASPRIVERSAVLGYRFASWLLRTLPAGPTGRVLGLGAQASYLLWPTKRAWSNRNFGHVLGLPPDHPRVRRLALRAYGATATYLVELMRVPFMPQDEVMALIEPLDPAEVARVREASPDGGMIVTTGHVGNNDVIGAAIAHLGLPLNVVADDSSFPELFELPPRPARAVERDADPVAQPAGDLRRPPPSRGARSARRLGLPQRRHPGPAVRRVDDAAGRPGHARGQDHSVILPVITTRQPDGRMRVRFGEPIAVASSDPAELQRATQADRRRARRDDPAGPRGVVQLQADLAGDRRRERRPRATRRGR